VTTLLTDEQLKHKAWEVLGEHLGPAEAMRFLRPLREQPRDYRQWRDQHFGQTVGDLAGTIRSQERHTNED